MKSAILAILFLAGAAIADEAAKPAAAPKKAKASMAIAGSEMKFADVPEAKGVQMAPIKGDMMKGPAKAMAKFAAGTMHPLHTHTADFELVIISGNFTYGADDASAKEYGPGSYIFIPGGYKHVSGCK